MKCHHFLFLILFLLPSTLISQINYSLEFDAVDGNNITTYYYRNTAVDSTGDESGYSAEESTSSIESFSEVVTKISGDWWGHTSWGDYENNGDLDILLQGYTGQLYQTASSKLYRNDAGTFVESSVNLLGLGGGFAVAGWTFFDGTDKNDIRPIRATIQGDTLSFNPVFDATVNGAYWRNSFHGSSNQLSIAFGDLDADGDFDLIQGSRYRLESLMNIGNNTNPEWEDLSWGNIVRNQNRFWTPELVDIDNDSDLDLFCGTLNGELSFWENIGNSLTPVWNTPNDDYLGISIGSFTRPVFCDIDNDSDYDLFIGNYTGEVHFFQNVGTASEPNFQDNGIYINTGVSGSVSPEFIDIDGDNDYDLFIGLKGGNIYYYENTGTQESAILTLMTTSYAGISLGWSYLQPRFIDIDNDNDNDLFLTDLNGFFYFYENIGDINSPVWSEITTHFNKILNFGRPSAPAVGDIDNDNDLDIIIGTHQISILRNVGTSFTPKWEWSGELAVSLNSFWTVPELVDIDADGDLDLFIGTVYGDLYYYENIGTPENPNWNMITTNYHNIDYGSNSHVSAEFADIDNDNDLDMFIQHFGCSPCLDSIDYYLNIGTNTVPVWQLMDNDYLSIGAYDISFGTNDFADIDMDGDFDCLVGTSHPGNFHLFLNIGSSQTADWEYYGLIAGGIGVEGRTSYSAPI